jgi:hypothetical protein
MSLDEKLHIALDAMQVALRQGYSFSSSPIDLLLELTTDLALLLSQAYREGRKERQVNPEVRFNYGKSDALGNPLSYKVFKTKKVVKDPEIAKFFKQLARLLVCLKKINKPFKEVYMTFLEKEFSSRDTPPKLGGQAKKPSSKRVSSQSKQAREAYHRRRKFKSLTASKIRQKVDKFATQNRHKNRT